MKAEHCRLNMAGRTVGWMRLPALATDLVRRQVSMIFACPVVVHGTYEQRPPPQQYRLIFKQLP